MVPLGAPADENWLGLRAGVGYGLVQASLGLYRGDWGRGGPVRATIDIGLGWGG